MCHDLRHSLCYMSDFLRDLIGGLAMHCSDLSLSLNAFFYTFSVVRYVKYTNEPTEKLGNNLYSIMNNNNRH